MRKKAWLVFVLIFWGMNLGAKDIELFPKQYGDRKVSAFFSLAGQNSIYKGKLLSILGTRTGVVFNGVHKLAFGFNTIVMPMRFDGGLCCGKDALGDMHELRFTSYSLIYIRTIFKSRIWEWTLPSFIDIGRGRIIHHSNNGLFIEETKNILSTRIEIQNRIFLMPWMALKWAAGYRVTLSDDPFWNRTLNTPYLNWGLSMDLKKMWFAIKGEQDWLWKKECRG